MFVSPAYAQAAGAPGGAAAFAQFVPLLLVFVIMYFLILRPQQKKMSQHRAMVAALKKGTIGGVGLDVTDPEPLPDGHPLWSIPNAIITPHVANPPQHLRPALLARVEVNVRRFANDMEPLAVIDADRGY